LQNARRDAVLLQTARSVIAVALALRSAIDPRMCIANWNETPLKDRERSAESYDDLLPTKPSVNHRHVHWPSMGQLKEQIHG
jgi:hypothetical protein